MKRWAFSLTLAGIFVLLLIFGMPAKEVRNSDELNKLEINQKVLLNGEVSSERDYEDFKIMQINEINLICECEGVYLGKDVKVEGVVSEYNEEKQINILKISIFG